MNALSMMVVFCHVKRYQSLGQAVRKVRTKRTSFRYQIIKSQNCQFDLIDLCWIIKALESISCFSQPLPGQGPPEKLPNKTLEIFFWLCFSTRKIMCFNLSLTLEVRSLHRLVPLCARNKLKSKKVSLILLKCCCDLMACLI